MSERRGVEFELSGRTLAALAGILVLVAGAGFWALRGGGDRAGEPGGTTPGAGPTLETLPREGALFDRTGEGAPARDASRQVTHETATAGRFELDLGRAATREDAERIAGLATTAGVRAAIVLAPQGGYRVAAGPFATEDEARKTAATLARILGQDVTYRALQ